MVQLRLGAAMASSGITVHLTKDSKLTGSHEDFPYHGQGYLRLKPQCFLKKELFTKPEFKACPASIGYYQLSPLSRAMQRLTWIRLKDTCKPQVPKFIHEGMSRFGICQGKYLMDCLTRHPHLLQRVVAPDQGFQDENHVGLFHFQFYRFGQWVNMVVEDLLPVVDGELFFAHPSDQDEFRMPLLEKAYAKLNETYEDLAWGSLNEAFVDFTGRAGQKFYLKIPNQSAMKKSAGLAKSSVMGTGLKTFGIFKKEKGTGKVTCLCHHWGPQVQNVRFRSWTPGEATSEEGRWRILVGTVKILLKQSLSFLVRTQQKLIPQLMICTKYDKHLPSFQQGNANEGGLIYMYEKEWMELATSP